MNTAPPPAPFTAKPTHRWYLYQSVAIGEAQGVITKLVYNGATLSKVIVKLSLSQQTLAADPQEVEAI